MAETKSGGRYLGTDGKYYDANGKLIEEPAAPVQPAAPKPEEAPASPAADEIPAPLTGEELIERAKAAKAEKKSKTKS